MDGFPNNDLPAEEVKGSGIKSGTEARARAGAGAAAGAETEAGSESGASAGERAAPPKSDAPLSEQTPDGEHYLIPGVEPVSERQRLEAKMRHAIQPRARQKPLDIGLFDEAARNQMELF